MQSTFLPVPGSPDRRARICFAALAAATIAMAARAQIVQGPSSSRTPYLVAAAPNPGVVRGITAVVTTTDLVPLAGGAGTYEFGGIPDGLGAYDNGDGTVTVLCNHELGTTAGIVRAHGALGAYVSELVVDKATLTVMHGRDLIVNVVDGAGIVHNAASANGLALNRFCSADLPAASGLFHAASGLGTQERIFMHGEEGGANGYQFATVATGPNRGTTYVLPKFNLSTNGSGLVGVGAWENTLVCPHAQDTTLVIGNNDGGTGIMNNSVAVYIGTKTNTGNEVERAGLTNGSLYFVNVAGNTAEIVNTTTRATNITSGTPFTLSGTASTTFSRPEDGQWNPLNPAQFYFVTTDRLDTLTGTGLNQTIGATGTAQAGRSRLWRLTFTDVTHPLLGGTIDLLIDGSKSGHKVQMFDNMTVGADGRIYLQEDPGNTTYIGKVWAYDVATDTLVQIAKFDPARWGDLVVNGGTPGALAPWTNDKESSGVIDVSHLFPHAADERVLLLVVQDHSSNAAVATPSSVEGGQLLLVRVALDAQVGVLGSGCGPTIAASPSARPALGSNFAVDVGNVPTGGPVLMMVGLSSTAFSGQPLPLALDGLGMTGCSLYQDLAVEGAALCTRTTPTAATYGLPIPVTYAGVGFSVWMQAWTESPAANPAGIVVTPALHLVVGF